MTFSDSTTTHAAPAARGAPAPRCPRYLSLDFWRGFACLLIVVFHATFYAATPAVVARVASGVGTFGDWLMAGCTWLWVGVPFFFVISGYCISATADSTRRKNAPVRQYFQRRLRRIFPPYWIFLAIAVVGVWVVERYVRPGLMVDTSHGFVLPNALSPLQWLGTLTLTETWRPHLFGPASRLFLQHAWTLCYEEQFYAVVGLILLISPKRFFLLASAVTFVVFALEILPYRRIPPLAVIHDHSMGFFFDGYWLYFAAGIGVYYFVNYAARRGRVVIAALLLLGVAWGVRSNIDSRTVSFAFALLLLGLHRWDARLANATWSRPVSWCGTMCYSLYLVHWPVTKAVSHALVLAGVASSLETAVVTVPVCIAASILAAWPFHILVERRFLNTPSHAQSATPESQPISVQAAPA